MMKWLLTFKPLGDYLFSDETSFDNANDDYISNDDVTAGKRQKYIIDTDLMPPQSTLMGAVRYLLLNARGLIRTDWAYTPKQREEMAGLVGGSSFSLEQKHAMGMINGLSPAFLVGLDRGNATKAYFPAPLDAKLEDAKAGKYTPLKELDEKGLWRLDKFKYKEFPQNGWLHCDVNNSSYAGVADGWVDEETLFIKYESPGYRLDQHEDAYHIKTRAKLKPIKEGATQLRLAFATIIDLADEYGELDPDLDMVTMGTKNGIFRVRAFRWEGEVLPALPAVKGERLWLPAPARLPASWKPDDNHALMLTKNVRATYTEFGKRSGRLRLNPVRYTFADAGSVFYFNNKQERESFASNIENDHAHKAGYNYTAVYPSR